MCKFTQSLAAGLLLLCAGLFSTTQAAPKQPLFNQGQGGLEQLPPQANRDRARPVMINYGQLRSGRLQLNLFDDLTIEAIRERYVTYKNRGEVWVGRSEDNSDSQITLARVGQSVHGTIQLGDDLYKLIPGQGRNHLLVQVDGKPPFPEPDPRVPGNFADSAADLDGSSDSMMTGSGDTTGAAVVDVMVVYTPNAFNATSNIESLILLAVEETNQAYINSGVNAQLNLVHTAAVNYSEAGSMQTDLENLTGTSDGYMDAVHDYRDTYGADMVSLLVKRSDYCGMAWLMGSPTTNFSSHAFSVVNYSCATGYYSFGHELGHNMGITHARQDTSNSGAYNYGFGYKDVNTETFRTIMAYNCASGCTRRQFFSNPDNDYNGIPTGVDYDLDPANAADNTRALNGVIANVASWRQPVSNTVPNAPSNLTATALSSSEIGLTWSDNANDENGFRVQRSGDGSTWTVVADLGSNATGFTDSALNASTQYGYRVNAYNSAGDSAYTNEASASTESAPSAFNQYITGESTDRGSVSGTYSALRLADGFMQKLTETHSGGKPSSRTGTLQHIWQFDLQPANAHTLKLLGSAAGGDEDFQLLYSTDGVNFNHSFVIAAGSGGTYQALLPQNHSGPLYVMAKDTDATPGNLQYDTLNLDQLIVVSENVLGDPPYPPMDLGVTGVSDSSVDLSWSNDNSISRSGTYVFRNGDLVATLSISASSYTDEGLAPATQYSYHLRAFNSAGGSADSMTVAATTQESTGPNLKAQGSKVKGSHRIDLTWSPAGEVDIYRDGGKIGSVSGSSHTDQPGTKGGATFIYKVCSKGTSNCSADKTVQF